MKIKTLDEVKPVVVSLPDETLAVPVCVTITDLDRFFVLKNLSKAEALKRWQRFQIILSRNPQMIALN